MLQKVRIGSTVSEALPWTGERYMPGMGGRIAAEHTARYAWAERFVGNKTVLDVASGEGYGSAILARTARHVTGIDLSEAAVAHARTTYNTKRNLDFRVGDIAALALEAQSIDVVVCFETIESVDDPCTAIAEIRRVLKPDGLLLISTPNRAVYSERYRYLNPFHRRELSLDEFSKALRGAFPTVRLFWQSSGVISVIGETHGNDSKAMAPAASSLNLVEVAAMAANSIPAQITPIYYVAVCTRSGLDGAISPLGATNLADEVLFEDEMLLRSAIAGKDADKSLLSAYLRLLDDSRSKARAVEEKIGRLQLIHGYDVWNSEAANPRIEHEASVIRRIFEGLQEEHRELWKNFEIKEKIIERVQEEKAVVLDEVESIKADNALFCEQIRSLEADLAAIHSSTSWRLLGRVRRFLIAHPRLRLLMRNIVAAPLPVLE
jgi:ubiquinone/menaquinone biosynthesis C-methylase UbiE